MMTCFLFLPPKVLLRSVVLLGLFFVSVRAVEEREESIGRDVAISCELGKMLHSLLTPTEIQSLQVQALRQELFRILLNVDEEEMKLIRYDEEHDNNEDFDAHKRSLASLARTGSIRYSKRNIEALARAGILKVPPQDREFDYKRSIATLAKNGQLPNYSIPEDNSESENENDDEEVKRSIEALARNGYLNQKRQQLTDLLNALTEDKRNIGSLARGFSLPSGKRNIASLAREYSLPFYGKRFLGSLARSGDLRTKKDYYDEMEDEKRNLASIVRNSGKRFIGALARNGDLRSKKDDMFDDEKRNIGSFMRNNEFPYAGKRYNYYEEFKRNIGSIAKGMSGRFVGKRNVAALLRQDNYLNGHRRNDIRSNRAQNDELNDDMKRNIASLKAQMKKRSVDINQNMSRAKREIDYPDNSDSDEYSVPVYQNSDGYDYEEMMQALNGAELPDKRFLGSVARSGWFRSPGGNGRTSRLHSADKRHIGSLARLGWLPAFRSARRFSRSGRSGIYDRPDYRPPSRYGSGESSENNSADSRGALESFSSSSTLYDTGSNGGFVAPIPGAKRYLLLPAVDSILLRKMYGHPHVPRSCV